MSRYNQFVGASGAQKINGADTDAGAAVLAQVTPLINSWMACCRLQAQSSGLGYYAKFLDTPLVRADWMWNNGNELLRVDVKSSEPTVTQKSEERPERKEEFEPYKDQPEEFSEPKPVFDEVELEEIQIENGLPPIPPELIKCFVVLYNDTDCVVYDMRSLEKDFISQRPLIENFQTQGSWELPGHVTVRRLRDYFGQAINGGSNQNYWDYVRPYCLQMTNNENMGPCAVSTVSFSGGVFSYSSGYSAYRLKSGLKSCQSVGGDAQIGQVGTNSGFPALNATDNVLYANAATFSLAEDGSLSLENADTYGHNSDLASTYSVPSTPIIPRFIDSDGNAHFDLAYNFAWHLPSMGERWLTGLFDTIPNDFKRPLTVGPTSASSTAAYPVLTQVNGLDVLTAKIIDISSELIESEFGSNTYYTYGSLPVQAGAVPGVFTVPYPPTENDYTMHNAVDGELTSTFLPAANDSGWDGRPVFGDGPEAEHTFLGYMQVSNGEYNLCAYALHSHTYDSGDRIWPLESYHFCLNGRDYTSTMESITGVNAEDIHYVFMDVPLFSAQTIKKFQP